MGYSREALPFDVASVRSDCHGTRPVREVVATRDLPIQKRENGSSVPAALPVDAAVYNLAGSAPGRNRPKKSIVFTSHSRLTIKTIRCI